LNTGAINVGAKRNFWKKAAAKTSTFAKNVEVQICRSFFQPFLQQAALNQVVVIPVPLEHVR